MQQLWVMQTKLAQEDYTKFLIEAIQKLGLNWAAFPIIPFKHSIPEFDWDGPRIYKGSTGLVTRVYETPEVLKKARLFYDHERHSTGWYGPRLGNSWLNYGSRRITVSEFLFYEDVNPSTDEFFCRPDTSLKSFSGGVFTFYEFRLLMERSLNYGVVKNDSVIIVSKPVNILKEYRTWVIGGEVSAIVGYKINGKVKPWDVSDYEKQPIADFAKTEGAKLSELEAFVLDVAVTDDGLRVVEINDVHASGYYRTEHIIDVVADLSAYIKKTS